jgi:hypothetical protein
MESDAWNSQDCATVHDCLLSSETSNPTGLSCENVPDFPKVIGSLYCKITTPIENSYQRIKAAENLKATGSNFRVFRTETPFASLYGIDDCAGHSGLNARADVRNFRHLYAKFFYVPDQGQVKPCCS